MKVFIRTVTELGPRTTVTQGLGRDEAYALAKAATSQEGSEAQVVEDGAILFMPAYIKKHKLRLVKQKAKEQAKQEPNNIASLATARQRKARS